MRIRTLAGVALALAVGATAAQAQGGGFPGGRGGVPGGRGGMGGEGRGRGGPRYGGPQAAPAAPDLSNPVKLIVASKDSLKLTADQVLKVDSVAKALDAQNEPLIAQVKRAFGTDSASLAARDSARRHGGPDYPANDDIALRDRLNVLKPTFKSIKENQDKAWKAAAALLTKPQRKEADAIRKEDEKVSAQERQRWQPRRRPGGDRGGDGF